jgi:hypothetical protein
MEWWSNGVIGVMGGQKSDVCLLIANKSILQERPLGIIFMVGAALSRECIAHECAPTEISNRFG